MTCNCSNIFPKITKLVTKEPKLLIFLTFLLLEINSFCKNFFEVLLRWQNLGPFSIPISGTNFTIFESSRDYCDPGNVQAHNKIT